MASTMAASPFSSPTPETLLKHLDEASLQAVELVRRYASIDPSSSSSSSPSSDDKDDDDVVAVDTNPWKDPDVILDHLKTARNELAAAWKALQDQYDQEKEMNGSNINLKNKESETEEDGDRETSVPDEKFRVLYMDMVTDAFGDVLDQMRLDNSNVDVDVLVDVLASGMEFLDPSEYNQSFFDAFEAVEVDDEEEDEHLEENDNGVLGMEDTVENEKGLTCQELRQRAMGYRSAPSAAATVNAAPVEG